MRTSFTLGSSLLLTLLSACAVAPSPSDGDTATSAEALAHPITTPWQDKIAYNDVAQISSHNSYETRAHGPLPVGQVTDHERAISIFDQLAYHHVRSLELDIHYYAPGNSGGLNIGNDFWIYHQYSDDRYPSCNTLQTCLREVAAFHATAPKHEPITIWIEPKDGWNYSSGQGPRDFDNDIKQYLGADALYTPGMLVDDCNQKGHSVSSLQEAVVTCGWPTLGHLRGKVMFVVMQTNVDDANALNLDRYLDNAPIARTAFAAYDPFDMRYKDAVFANINGGTYDQIKSAINANAGAAAPFIVLRNEKDDLGAFDDMVNNTAGVRVQHLATERVNIDRFPHYVTLDKTSGFPFRPYSTSHSTATIKDDEAFSITLTATSGNLDGTADSMVFRHTFDVEDSVEWTASFSSTSDSDSPAKGCLMARMDTSPGSKYFAVCRPDGRHATEVRWRDAWDAPPNHLDFGIETLQGATQGKIVLRHVDAGAPNDRWCADGEMSNDGGVSYSWIGRTICFDGPLSLVGLAVSSYGNPQQKYVFGSVTSKTPSQTWIYDANGFERSLALGAHEDRFADGAY